MKRLCASSGMLLCGALAWSFAAAARTEDKPFTWIAVADHFEEPAEGLVERMVEAKPALVVGVGDLVFKSSPRDFEGFKRVILQPLAKVGAKYYPLVGNHDFPVEPNWFKLWEPPLNRLYYSFDHGNCHFIALDTNKAITRGRKFKKGSERYFIETQGADFEPGSEQYRWLVADLQKTRKKHIFVFFHIPAFSYGGHHGMPSIRKALCPLFDKFRVTAVFAGHSHGYERFVPLRVSPSGSAVRDDRNGVVYIVTAGGGMRLYSIQKHQTHAATAKEFHFVKIEMKGETADCTTIRAGDGTVLDSFTLRSRRP